jgi:hypothetical protein
MSKITPYSTYYIRSWYDYQRTTPSHLHSIEHYNKMCEEHATLYGDNVMVLRENITKITGYYWYSNGYPGQVCAETDGGYTDVRTGKIYPRDVSFFDDISVSRST